MRPTTTTASESSSGPGRCARVAAAPRRFRAAFPLGWALIVAASLGQAPQLTLFLDLTTPKVEQLERSTKVFCGGVSGGAHTTGVPYKPPELALRMEIVSISHNRLAPGEPFTVDARLTNAGKQDIALPWDPDFAVVYGEDCKGLGPPGPGRPITLVGSLMLWLTGTGGEEKAVGGHYIYARMNQSTTYRTLAPGRSAVIRVGGKFNPPSPPRHGHTSLASGRFKLTATFDLTESAVVDPFRTVVSANSVNVSPVAK